MGRSKGQLVGGGELVEQRKSSKKQGKPLIRLGIIGLSQSPALLEQLDKWPVEVVAIADFAFNNEALNQANGKGIFVTQDYTELLERRDIDLIVNLIPDQTVEAIIHQLKPESVHVLHSGVVSSVMEFADQWSKRRLLLELFRELSEVISASLAPVAFVQRSIEKLEEAMGLEGLALWTRKKEGMVLSWARGAGEVWHNWGHLLEESGIFSQLMEEKAPIIVKNLEAKFPVVFREMGTDAVALSMVIVPAIKELEVVGAMALFHEKENILDEEDWQIISLLANVLVQILARIGEMTSFGESAIRDEVTGLYNAAYFWDRIKSEIKRAARKDSQVSLLYLTPGLDQTDPFNKRRARNSLVPIASKIKGCIRDMDIPARYKGNNIAILLPDTPPSGALKTASRLLEQISKAGEDLAQGEFSNISIGLASFPNHARSARELLQNAEFAAFLARREGEGQIRIFPVSNMDVDGLSPEMVLRDYPCLKEAFDLLEAKSKDDPSVLVHAKEVAKYSALIARELGLESARCIEMGAAGWMHDLGKVALPTPDGKIRLKSPKLKELNLKLHPAVGAVMLRNIGASGTIVKGVFYHHARYDGTGHPSKLKGDGIPLEGRIVAVADTFHHFMAQRETSEPDSTHLVFQRLREKGGRELDPSLVECLIKAVSSR